MSKLKLPKQWKHWIYRVGLRPHGRKYTHGTSNWLYFKGKGHVWRIARKYDDNNMLVFQRGDTIEEFDRWALCDIIETPWPFKNFNEFEEFVNTARGKNVYF